jgi:hypothetical protein
MPGGKRLIAADQHGMQVPAGLYGTQRSQQLFN